MVVATVAAVSAGSEGEQDRVANFEGLVLDVRSERQDDTRTLMPRNGWELEESRESALLEPEILHGDEGEQGLQQLGMRARETYCVANARVLHLNQYLIGSQVLDDNPSHLEVPPWRIHHQGFRLYRELHFVVTLGIMQEFGGCVDD